MVADRRRSRAESHPQSHLEDQLDLTGLFIAHDLAVVERICDPVAVMYVGRIMEIVPASTSYDEPNHPCPGALPSAVPVLEPGR